MSVALIVAASTHGVIGVDGRLPWHLPDDLARFKDLTMGHSLIMGRRTWDSIGRPLPGRKSIVLTRQAGFEADGACVVASLQDAIDAAEGTAFVIGGGEVYGAARSLADRVYLTVVHADIEGDTLFPALDGGSWACIDRVEHPADERHDHAMTFEIWSREA